MNILHKAEEIRTNLVERFPYYAEKLQRVRFVLNGRLTNRAGQARYRTFTVEISRPIFNNPNNWHGLKNTILHEIAHLLVGQDRRHGKPHGPVWQLMHRTLGGDGKRCHSLQTVQRPKYTIVCNRCGMNLKIGATRARRVSHYFHRRCGGKFSVSMLA